MADHQCSAQYGGHLGQEGVAAGASAGLSNAGHHSANANTPSKYTQQPQKQWRLEVTEPEGRVIDAKWCSENKCESAMGVFRGNGDLLLVDVDGLFIGSVGAGKGREIRALLFGDW